MVILDDYEFDSKTGAPGEAPGRCPAKVQCDCGVRRAPVRQGRPFLALDGWHFLSLITSNDFTQAYVHPELTTPPTGNNPGYVIFNSTNGKQYKLRFTGSGEDTDYIVDQEPVIGMGVNGLRLPSDNGFDYVVTMDTTTDVNNDTFTSIIVNQTHL